jgi:hypothetical protein
MLRYKVVKFWKSTVYVNAKSIDEANSKADELVRPPGSLECIDGHTELLGQAFEETNAKQT